MKARLLFLFLLFSIPLYAQEERSKFDLRFGIGNSLLGSGDIITTTLENEVNYKLNRYFTTAFSLNFGRSSYDALNTASYTQGNLNIYLSPFKNSRRNDFRIGAGLSYYKVSDALIQLANYDRQGNLVQANYLLEVRDSFGGNIILEDTHTIKERFLVGLKLFIQPYLNGDINSGVLLKIGVKL